MRTNAARVRVFNGGFMSCKRFLTNTLLVGVLGAGSIAYADDAENISQCVKS